MKGDAIMETFERRYRIVVRSHTTTGLMVGISPDHPGLNVFGRSEDEIGRLLPAALRALLEAEGVQVMEITAKHETADVRGFNNPSFVAEAKLAA